MKIQDIVTNAVQITVKIRGTQHSYRLLTAGESSDVRRAIPQPSVPLMPHPRYGSADKTVPMIPNKGDGKYMAAETEWNLRISAAELVIGLGFENDKGATYASLTGANEHERFAWITGAAAELLGKLSEAEVWANWQAIQSGVAESIKSEAVRPN